MFDDLRVGRDDAVDFPRSVEYGGVGGAVGEDLSAPVEEAVAVEEEIGEGSDERVDSEAMSGGSLGSCVEKEDVK